jgi:hypothetical protein
VHIIEKVPRSVPTFLQLNLPSTAYLERHDKIP